MDTRQNPQLSIELLRESHLEMLNDFTSCMEAVTKEGFSALAKMADDMAHFSMPITGKPHYMQLETRSGSMGRTL